MTDAVVLSLRSPLVGPLDASGIAPDRFRESPLQEILGTRVHHAGNTIELGDLFAGTGERSDRVRLEGNLALVSGIGAGMSGGELIVEGDAGAEVGAGMTGGFIDIRGNAGAGAGSAAPGARRGMSGGEIVIRGSAGPETGRSMRRGLIAIGGDAAPYTGLNMVAGTVVVCGATDRGAGTWSKRGSVVALGTVTPPPTYRYACSYRPVHLRLTLLHLQRRRGLAVDERHISGLYRRYSGDVAELGKGEILAWAAE